MQKRSATAPGIARYRAIWFDARLANACTARYRASVRQRLVFHVLRLREHLREARTFFRFPLRVSFAAPTGGPATGVLLYGVPYADWNAPLADRRLWEGVRGVADVLRLPAVPVLSALIARFAGNPQIVIPSKMEHAARLPRHWRSLSPDRASIRALGDKRQFAIYMAANGLGDYCPTTYAGPADAVFPCVMKRLDLASSRGIVVVNSRAEFENHLQSDIFHRQQYTLQALVAGTVEHATYCICKDGAVLWHCTFLTEVAHPDTVKSEDNVLRRWKIETPGPIVRQIEKVLAPLAYSGPCNLDYKLGPDGKIRIFEINPRLGGSLMMPQYGEDLRQALSCIVDNAT
jgi:hypothetical protein